MDCIECIRSCEIRGVVDGCSSGERLSLYSYETDVTRTARPNQRKAEALLEAAVGAASEAGEVAGIIKKVYFQGHDFDRDKFIEELGDALYYITKGLIEVDSSLAECMRVNVAKRQAIYPNGFDPERSKARAK